MKRVLIFGMSPGYGGVENFIMNYYRNIDRTQIQFDFIVTEPEIAYKKEIERLGGKIYQIPSRRKNLFKYIKAFNKFCKENMHNYIAIWSNLCSLSNITLLKYGRKYGIKKRIVHAHNSQNMNKGINGIITYIFHNFHRLTISRYATDYWSCSERASNWFFNSNIQASTHYNLISNAIDVNLFKYNEKERLKYRKILNVNHQILLGNVGRFHMQKNHFFLIDIFNELHKIYPQSLLILVGGGELESKIRNKVESLNLDKYVIFAGIRNDIAQILQAIDIFIMPSLFEGLPLALIEAQCAGLPCVISNNICDEAIINDDILELDLSESAKYWANEILSTNIKVNRENGYDKLQQSKYNIYTQIHQFQNLLLN